MNSISYFDISRKHNSSDTYKVVSVNGNIVRVKSGLFTMNVTVEYPNRKVILPEGITAHNFRTLVGIVLEAFEKENVSYANFNT